jgi:DNA repair protein RadC
LAKNIIDLPINDRPYEKLEHIGEENLTNSELLAIIIKNGTKRLNCLEISQNILKINEQNTNISDLEYLTNLSLEELKQNDGIGRVKAIQIKAVVELSKRISNIYIKSKDKISCPKDVFNILMQGYLGKKQECLKTILLNKQNKIISIVTNAIGSNDKINIGLKEVFSEPIKQIAHGIILVHNHPSGSLEPSKQDIHFTKNVIEYSKIFNINLLDHIIIAGDNYISLKEKGYM